MEGVLALTHIGQAVDGVKSGIEAAKAGYDKYQETGDITEAALIAGKVGIEAYAERKLKIARGADVVEGGEKGGLNLFKWSSDSTTKPEGWKEGDFMLHLKDQGSSKANWKQNSGDLREQMGKGNPIKDSYRDPATGQQIPTGGFLNAERKLLEPRGWKYDSTGSYHPPSGN